MRRTGLVGASTWSAIDIVGRQATAFFFSIALARILAPADFGVAVLAVMCSAILVAVLQTGIVTWLVSRAETSHEEENAAFWFCLLGSSFLAAALVALSPLLAGFFEYPVLKMLLWAAAAQVVLAALGAIQTGLLTRGLAMKRLAIAGMAATLVSGALSVGMALSGAGAVSIVLPLAVNNLVNTALLWLLCPWRPSLAIGFASLRRHVHFLRNLSASNVLDAIYGNVSSALLGKLHGATDLGLYNRAQGTQQLPGNIVAMAATRIMLPVFVDSAEHPERVRRDMEMSVQVVMLFTLPAMATLAAAADLVIETLFGAKWLPAAPLLTILAIGGALVPLHTVNLQFMLAQGRSDQYLRVETIKKLLGIFMLSVGSLEGIVGVAIAQSLHGILAFFINARFAGRVLDYGPWKQLRDLIPSLAISLVMALMVLAIKFELAWSSPVELLLALAVAGGLFVMLTAIRGSWLERRGSSSFNLMRTIREARRRAPNP